jgi:predicted acyl esterase
MKSLPLCLAAVLAVTACETAPTAGPDAATTDAATADTGDATATDTARDGADAGSDTTDTKADTGPPQPFVVRGSIRQVFVTHAPPNQPLSLRDAASKEAAQGKTDKWGSFVFRKVAPGKGYTVKSGDAVAGPVDVIDTAASTPPADFYSKQQVQPGYGYLTMRDGTTLAYFATLPGPADKGPYPTVVNYSGYAPAQPGKALVGKDQEALCESMPVLCAAPNDPSALVMALGNYATVSVNVRGTGCSGGAYDYFEELQLLDGHDVIEIVAAQPWVAHHQVGMVGLSYPGITQLFVAKTQPKGLAAIAPLSVIGNTATTLAPGGILNKGFALNWIKNVLDKAAPYGQGWEQARVDGGDDICKENQLLHDQRVNNVDQAKDTKNYVPEVMAQYDPSGFAGAIQVPVFLAGGWQDEQTGSYFNTLMERLKSAPSRRFIVYNGVHADGFAPLAVSELKAFLDLFVARKVPERPPFWGLVLPEFFKNVFGVAVDMPEDRWKGVADWAAAKAKWLAEPEVMAVIESGGTSAPGTPVGRFVVLSTTWPAKDVQVERWYLQPGGALLPVAPTATPAASSFLLDPKAGDRGMGADGLWSTKTKWTWIAPGKGNEVAFVTPPLDADRVMLGTGSVDLWVRATASDVDDGDFEVNLSEVRPDGQELYVQSGWLRASFRALAKTATALWPEPTMTVTDSQPLKPGEWTPLRVAIPGFGHVFRAGSQIRLTVDTPGDSRVDWRFDLKAWPHPVHYDVAHDAARPSSVALPLLKGQKVPAEAQKLPGCNTLRGQPCRVYQPNPNAVAVP